MTKKMISWLSFMAVFCLMIYSCRTDESIYEKQKHDRSETDKIEAFSKFESHLPSVNTTGKSSSEYVSYHEPFKEIIQNFMNNNPEYAERFQREAGDIYFDLRSLTYGETTKGLAYPIMKDGIVNAVLIAMVNEKRDWVTFIVLKNSSSEVTSMMGKFQKFYDALGKAKGREQMQEEQIEEVVIVIYQSIPGPSYIYYQPYTDYGSSIGLGSGMSGGPTIHQGSGFYNPSQNPCSKIKSVVNNPKLKPKIDELKNFSLTAVEDEMGYHQDKSGNVTPADVNGNHHVDFTINQNSLGGIHNHTLNGAQIFSPRDILTLLDFAGVQNQTLPIGSTADNTGNAFLGMISQSGSYFITFNGGSGDLPPPMTQAEEDALEIEMNKAYRKKIEKLLKVEGKNNGDDLSQDGLQKLFFAIVKEMGLEGKINLIKQNGSNTSTIEQNSDGTIKEPIPC